MKTGKKCGLFLGIFLLCLACFPFRQIRVQAEGLDCYLPQTAFSLRWRHSVEHQLWQEDYRLEKNFLILDRTLLQTFGAGTPYSGEILHGQDGYVAYKQRISLAEINWVVSRNMQGSILLDSGDIPIYRLVPDYSVVQFRVSRPPFLIYLLESSCYE